jgi:hypothetical protein
MLYVSDGSRGGQVRVLGMLCAMDKDPGLMTAQRMPSGMKMAERISDDEKV